MRDAGGRHQWPVPDGVHGGAEFSPDGDYRYMLWRAWTPRLLKPDEFAAFVGMNPSTAAEDVDDPTVRKCWQWAREWGFNSFVMLNVFAYRATNPADLRTVDDPVGPDNDDYLRTLARQSRLCVVAWGCRVGGRYEYVARLLGAGADLYCVGTNKNGSPKHPLYVRSATRPVPWTPPS